MISKSSDDSVTAPVTPFSNASAKPPVMNPPRLSPNARWHRRLPGDVRMWSAITATTLLAGYADFWRGGDTIAPVLVLVGYLVLVPITLTRT